VSTQFQFIGFDKAALRITLLEPKIRTRVQHEIVETTNAALALANQFVPRLSGELARTLRADISKSGMTGQVKAGFGNLPSKRKGESARIRRVRGAKELGPQLPGAYAAIVEWGSQGRPGHHYLMPAAEGVREQHQQRIANAILEGVKDVAAGGDSVG
jgi:hypothetical protein